MVAPAAGAAQCGGSMSKPMVAVKVPGEGEGGDDLPDGAAARRWTTVALCPDELGWLREALAFNAADDEPDDSDDELGPL
jgi:hypothetical protein